MSSCVIDSSALLAYHYGEPGATQIAEALERGASISTVNFSEVVATLAGRGAPDWEIRETLEALGLDIMPFDTDLAFRAGILRPTTRQAGLSFGDRACLALADRMGVPALTADRAWENISVGVEIRLIR